MAYNFKSLLFFDKSNENIFTFQNYVDFISEDIITLDDFTIDKVRKENYHIIEIKNIDKLNYLQKMQNLYLSDLGYAENVVRSCELSQKLMTHTKNKLFIESFSVGVNIPQELNVLTFRKAKYYYYSCNLYRLCYFCYFVRVIKEYYKVFLFNKLIKKQEQRFLKNINFAIVYNVTLRKSNIERLVEKVTEIVKNSQSNLLFYALLPIPYTKSYNNMLCYNFLICDTDIEDEENITTKTKLQIHYEEYLKKLSFELELSKNLYNFSYEIISFKMKNAFDFFTFLSILYCPINLSKFDIKDFIYCYYSLVFNNLFKLTLH